MGRSCGTFWRQERFTQGFGGENQGKELIWKKCVDGRIILKCLFKKWDGVMN